MMIKRSVLDAMPFHHLHPFFPFTIEIEINIAEHPPFRSWIQLCQSCAFEDHHIHSFFSKHLCQFANGLYPDLIVLPIALCDDIPFQDYFPNILILDLSPLKQLHDNRKNTMHRSYGQKLFPFSYRQLRQLVIRSPSLVCKQHLGAYLNYYLDYPLLLICFHHQSTYNM